MTCTRTDKCKVMTSLCPSAVRWHVFRKTVKSWPWHLLTQVCCLFTVARWPCCTRTACCSKRKAVVILKIYVRFLFLDLILLFDGYRQTFATGVKLPGREHGLSSPSRTVKVKNEWSCTSSLPVCLHGVHGDFDLSTLWCVKFVSSSLLKSPEKFNKHLTVWSWR